MNDFEVILVHGTGGHDADWFPGLTNELEKRGVRYQLPALPNNPPIQVGEWLEGLDKAVQKATKPIVFVGYSLGTRTILLYLEKHKVEIKHMFFIATFLLGQSVETDDDDEYPSFFTHAIDAGKIKAQTENITILHSKDDDSIPYNQAVELSGILDAELMTYNGKGHFYQPEYVKDVMAVLEEKLDI